MSNQIPVLGLDFVRSQFPALAGDWVFFDNAGGSQTLKRVVDHIGEFLLTSNVQLGASYAISQQAGKRLQQATQAVTTLINAAHPSEVVMGSSTTLLLRILALCLGQTFSPGDEVIVTNCDHESNIGAWLDLRKQGLTVKFWNVNPETWGLDPKDLKPLLTDKTRLVALTHASNILGTINPIRAIADLVHAHGALICVDGVAYAPHRLVDVQALDVDFYAFSFYKVYGPHHAVLYGKREHLLAMPGINHCFIPETQIPYKLQPGNVNYELSYGLLGLCEYLRDLAQYHQGKSFKQPVEQPVEATPTLDLRQSMVQAFELISAHEQRLSDRLLQFLNQKSDVRVIGKREASQTQRVPTIAFVVNGMDSATIPPQMDLHKVGIRYGDFYAKRLIEDLGLAAQNGVARVSMVHYNTIAEVDRLIEYLDPIL